MDGYKSHGSHESEMNESGVIRVDYCINPDLGEMQMGGSEQDVRDSLKRGVEGFGYATPQMPVTHSSDPNDGITNAGE